MKKQYLIPLLKPSVSKLEKKYVNKVLDSGWWGLGPKTAEFEEKFAKYTGFKYAVGLTSATAALDLAVKAYDIKDGEVIVPALTFVSTALAPLYNNNRIVFADIDEETLCIDWEDVERKITNKTKAVIPVHYAGKNCHPEIMSEINSDIVVIEDASHAVGSKGVGKYTSCWSFHAVKNLACGDGGMITTDYESIYQKLIPLRWCGIDKSTWERSKKKYGWDYSIETIGYKYHMNDIIASIGLAQLERVEQMNKMRKLRVLQYLEELRNVSWITLPKWDEEMSWHLFVVRIKRRDEFIDHMLAHGVSVGVHYKPLNTYPIFEQQKLPVTDSVWKTLVTLPLFPDMTDDEFGQIIKTIKDFK